MPQISDLQAAINQIIADAALYHSVMHGGITQSVTTEGGPVRSVAKAISDIQAQIQTGFSAGYVQVVANETERASTTPAQIGQLLFQRSDQGLFYAAGTTAASWTPHPLYTTQEAAQEAIEDVAAFADDLADRMETADYTGSGTGVVNRAAHLQEALTLMNDTAHPSYARRVYGIENNGPGYTEGMLLAGILNPAHKLVDGVDQRSVETVNVTNTSRKCQAKGTNFALLGAPRRLVAWGAQTSPGILGVGISGSFTHLPRAVLSMNQNAAGAQYPAADWDSNAINTPDGVIEEICSQNGVTLIRTLDGKVLVAGGIGLGIDPLFGSGIDKTQAVFMPILFNPGDNTSRTIVMMDAVDDLATTATVKNATGIFVDDNDELWILGTNPKKWNYNSSYIGPDNSATNLPAIKTPKRLVHTLAGNPVPGKIRCDISGNVYVLFNHSNGTRTLWAGGGSNTSGHLARGDTQATRPTTLSAPGTDANVVIQDFEVSGHSSPAELALWVLKGGVLYAAGYNGYGQFGKALLSGAVDTASKSSWVNVTPTNKTCNLVRLGGTAAVTVIYRLTDNGGTYYGLGYNTDGCLGEADNTQKVFQPKVLNNLKALLGEDANGDLVDICISGYNNKHATCVVCANGKAFTAGNNTDGCLANGTTTGSNTWQEVLWSPIDPYEKIIDVSSVVAPSGGPGFTWRTNYGRVLQAGPTASGFATGVASATPYTVLTANPVQLNVIL